jgi:hypothetical protein
MLRRSPPGVELAKGVEERGSDDFWLHLLEIAPMSGFLVAPPKKKLFCVALCVGAEYGPDTNQ